MAITLSYTGESQYTKIAEATRIAHDFLQGSDIINIIQAKRQPFDDCVPKDLDPTVVAAYMQRESFTLSVMNYQDCKKRTNIGGRFRPKYSNLIEINVLALPRREACEFAGVLIHESVHALSRRIRTSTNGEIYFSHTPNERKGNEDTAPYWIQTQAENFLCGSAFLDKEPLIIDHEEDDDF